jgi:hypothetical protein
MFDRLSFLVAHPAPSFFFFRPIPVLSLFIPTSESRHHFSLSRILPPQVHRNILGHTPIILPVVPGFCDSLPSLLMLIFPLLHWHTRFSNNISLSPSSACFFSFLSSNPLVSCTLPFHLFCFHTFPLSFPLSRTTCSSLALSPHYVP